MTLILMEDQSQVGHSSYKALSNPLILENILQHVDCSFDLLQWRRVNWTWRHVISHILRRRCDLPLKFHYEDESNLYRQLKSPGNPRKKLPGNTLSDFLHFLPKSTDFPSSSFSFCNGRLSDPELQRFLTIHGQHVRRLEFKSFFLLKRHFNPTSGTSTFDPSLLRHLILAQAPNLQALYLDGNQFGQLYGRLVKNSNADMNPSPYVLCTRSLPCLKILGFRFDGKIETFDPTRTYCQNYPKLELLQEMMDHVAVNLERLDFVDDNLCTTEVPLWLCNIGRLHLLSSFTLWIQPATVEGGNGENGGGGQLPFDRDLERLTDDSRAFSSSQWRLLRFTILFDDSFKNPATHKPLLSRSLLTKSTKKILQESRLSLETLNVHVISLDKINPKIFLPPSRFPKLTTLHLRMGRRLKERISFEFETSGGQFSFCYAESFPNLKEILVNGRIWWLSDYQKGTTTLKTTKTASGQQQQQQKQQEPRPSHILLSCDSLQDLHHRYGKMRRPKFIKVLRHNPGIGRRLWNSMRRCIHQFLVLWGLLLVLAICVFVKKLFTLLL